MSLASNDFDTRAGQTSRLVRLQAGRLDPDAEESLFQWLHTEALRIARAQHQRRGSPDGIAGASDLANSQLADIWKAPEVELQNVATTDDFRRVLQRMLLDRWIDRRRRAQAAKRGGGKVVPASQLTRESDSGPLPAALAPPDESEFQVDLAEISNLFPPDGVECRILKLLVEGCTQAEIGRQVGLSRDAVGRRIRQTIVPMLTRLWKGETDA